MNEKLPDLGLEVGDLVEGYGVKGEVISITNNTNFPVNVKFEYAGRVITFLRDGKIESWHKLATIKLIEKKIKPKRKVTLYRYTYASGDYFYKTAWSNDPETCKNINIIKTETKEVEIEEL